MRGKVSIPFKSFCEELRKAISHGLKISANLGQLKDGSSIQIVICLLKLSMVTEPSVNKISELYQYLPTNRGH